jgi:hypothetical protein
VPREAFNALREFAETHKRECARLASSEASEAYPSNIAVQIAVDNPAWQQPHCQQLILCHHYRPNAKRAVRAGDGAVVVELTADNPPVSCDSLLDSLDQIESFGYHYKFPRPVQRNGASMWTGEDVGLFRPKPSPPPVVSPPPAASAWTESTDASVFSSESVPQAGFDALYTFAEHELAACGTNMPQMPASSAAWQSPICRQLLQSCGCDPLGKLVQGAGGQACGQLEVCDRSESASKLLHVLDAVKNRGCSWVYSSDSVLECLLEPPRPGLDMSDSGVASARGVAAGLGLGAGAPPASSEPFTSVYQPATKLVVLQPNSTWTAAVVVQQVGVSCYLLQTPPPTVPAATAPSAVAAALQTAASSGLLFRATLNSTNHYLPILSRGTFEVELDDYLQSIYTDSAKVVDGITGAKLDIDAQSVLIELADQQQTQQTAGSGAAEAGGFTFKFVSDTDATAATETSFGSALVPAEPLSKASHRASERATLSL